MSAGIPEVNGKGESGGGTAEERFRRYTQALEETLIGQELPGVAAQKRLAPVNKLSPEHDPVPPESRQAAVLILLFPLPHTGESETREQEAAAALSTREEVGLVLIERPHDGSTHAGEIALPGGAREGAERFPGDTALREAHEEIGVPAEAVRLLGALTPIYVPVSNYSVVPLVATAEERPPMRPQPAEVARIHTTALARLAGPPAMRTLQVNKRRREAPGFPFGDHFIWGATAMMLAELMEIDRTVRGESTPSSG